MDPHVELLKRMFKGVVPQRRRIEGTEYEHVMTMLRLLDPVASLNSQRFETTIYIIGDKEYRLTTGDGIDIPELEETIIEN